MSTLNSTETFWLKNGNKEIECCIMWHNVTTSPFSLLSLASSLVTFLCINVCIDGEFIQEQINLECFLQCWCECMRSYVFDKQHHCQLLTGSMLSENDSCLIFACCLFNACWLHAFCVQRNSNVYVVCVVVCNGCVISSTSFCCFLWIFLSLCTLRCGLVFTSGF